MTRFGYLATATALGAFVLIIMGGVVRVSGSGLGCPDWPLCHGRLTPPMEASALIEYSHRLLVTAVGLLVLATAVTAWRARRRQRWVVAAATTTLVLLLVQAGLGGATVKSELEPALVVVHLGLALLFLSSAATTALATRWASAGSSPTLALGAGRGRRLLPWLGAAAAATYAAMLVGSYIGASGAGLACPDLPLCDGDPLPLDDRFVQAHLLHRSLAVVSALLVLATVVQALRLRPRTPWLARLLALAAASVLLQIFLGAANIWLETPPALVVAHLGNGALLWAALTAAALLLVWGVGVEAAPPRLVGVQTARWV